MNQIIEIRNFLLKKSNKKAMESWKKFIPTKEKVYGVYLAEINKIVSKYKTGGFELVKTLWDSGYLEERLLSAKILGKICKKNPELTLKLINSFVNDLEDWATCDTLATQGIRAIAKIKEKEIFELSKKMVNSKKIWEKRFGIVLLINFKKEKALKQKIETIIKPLENDKEYYVKKAIVWIKKSLK